MSGVKIKPLVWESGIQSEFFSEWSAQTPLGKFRVLFKPSRGFYLYCTPLGVESTKTFNVLSDVQLYAQSEYERRVRECLE